MAKLHRHHDAVAGDLMDVFWPESDRTRITTPQAQDLRGRAIIGSLDAHFADHPPATNLKDPETCPASVLPALIAEWSMEEFIAPDLPEHVVRRILKNRWALKKNKGYDPGVELGLELLGTTPRITQWYQQEPMGAPNTHVIEIFTKDILFPDETYFGAKQMRATHRMIDATKRWSQGTSVRLGFVSRAKTYQGSFTTVCHIVNALPYQAKIPHLQTPIHVGATTQITRFVNAAPVVASSAGGAA